MQRFAMMPLAGLLLSGVIKAARVFDAPPVDITLIFALIVLLQSVAVLVRSRFTVPAIALWVIAPFAVALPAAMWGPTTELANAKVVELFTLALLSAVAPLVLVRRRRHLVQLAGWLALFGAAAALDALLAGPVTAAASGLRLTFGGSGNPLSLGRAAGTAIVVLAVAGARRDLHWLVASIAATPLAVVLFRTASQGPALAALIGLSLVVLGMRLGRRRMVAALIAVVVSGSVVVLGMQAATDEQRERLVSVDHNEHIRLEMWGDSLSVAATAPHGIGWGGFNDRIRSHHAYPHNVWIEAILEGGWLLGLLFALLTVAALQRAWKATRKDTAALYVLAVTGAWVANAAFSGSLPGNRTLLGMLTVAAVTPTLVRQSQRSHEGMSEISIPRAMHPRLHK
jgi:O-antigen ligase